MKKSLHLFALLALLILVQSVRADVPPRSAIDSAPKTVVSDAQEDKPLGAIMEMKLPKGAKVFFVNLKNGATVQANKPFKVKFGVKGMKIHPAGELKDGTGHHHLTIDVPAVDQGMPVPADDKHIHYGKGQTEGEITLAAGKHRLTLQFANGAHISYGPVLSATIEVTAK